MTDKKSSILNNSKKGKAYLYCRVSTNDQEEDGVSLETQEKKMIKYCDYKDVGSNYEIFREIGSGKDIKGRPILGQIINDIKSGETLIVAELSRFSRSPLDALSILETFKKKGINFVSLDPEIDFSTSTGKFMFGILMIFFENERERIGENIKKNMQRLSEEGKLRTKPPFGYKFVEKKQDFVEVPEQIAVISLITEMWNKDPCPGRIAKTLNEQGYNKVLVLNKPNPEKIENAPLFHTTTVNRILIDYGIKSDKKDLRTSIKERIVSHHKEEVSS